MTFCFQVCEIIKRRNSGLNLWRAQGDVNARLSASVKSKQKTLQLAIFVRKLKTAVCLLLSEARRSLQRVGQHHPETRSGQWLLCGAELLRSRHPQTFSHRSQRAALCQWVAAAIRALKVSARVSSRLWLLSNLNLAENKAVGVMKPGHVFTIEPMICEGEKKLFMSDGGSQCRRL